MSVSSYFHQTPELLREEQLWVIQAQSDPTKFDPLYRKYYSPILRYLQQRMDDHEAANDVASQVFVKAMKNINKYEFRGVPFGSWLYRIAKSELYQQFRENQSKKTVRMDNIQIASFDELFFEGQEQEIHRQRLFVVLQSLKPEQLKIIEMRFFEQMSFKEIGEQLGLTENNAKVKTFRVLEKIRVSFRLNSQAA